MLWPLNGPYQGKMTEKGRFYSVIRCNFYQSWSNTGLFFSREKWYIFRVTILMHERSKIITNEKSKRSFFFACHILNVYDEISGKSTRPSDFCKPYILTTMSHIFFQHKLKYAHFSILWIFKFSKQSTKPSEYEIYSNRKYFKQILNKMTIVSVISPKLSKLWSKLHAWIIYIYILDMLFKY